MPFILRCIAFCGRGGILTWFGAIASYTAFICVLSLVCRHWRQVVRYFPLSFFAFPFGVALPFLFSLLNRHAAMYHCTITFIQSCLLLNSVNQLFILTRCQYCGVHGYLYACIHVYMYVTSDQTDLFSNAIRYFKLLKQYVSTRPLGLLKWA